MSSPRRRPSNAWAGAAFVSSVTALAGCALLPGPTQIVRGDPTVVVEYENRSDQRYALKLTEGDILLGSAEILRCSANGTGMNLGYYEAAGWTMDGSVKDETIGDVAVREVRYRIGLRDQS